MAEAHQTFQSAVQAFEQTCRDAQQPELRELAEARLAEVGARVDAIDVCLAVVQETNQPEARHQACNLLRRLVLERWNTLSTEMRFGQSSALRIRLVNLAVQKQMQVHERSALLRLVATLVHRAYFEELPNDRASFITALCRVVCQPSKATAASEQVTGLETLDFVVNEFWRPMMPSAMSTEDMERCEQARNTFAGNHGELFMIYRATAEAFALLFTGGVDASALPLLAHRCLALLTTILGHDVRTPATNDADVVLVVHRGPEWHEVLGLHGRLVQMLYKVCEGMNPATMSQADELLFQYAREALMQIASVSRRSYPSSQLADEALHGLLEIEKKGWASSQSDSARLLYSEVWRRIAVAHGLHGIVQSGSAPVMSSFEQNTIQVLRNAQANDSSKVEVDDDVRFECRLLLVETWSSFCFQAESAGQSVAIAVPAWNVLQHFLGSMLVSTETVADEGRVPDPGDDDEDFGYDDESREDALIDALAALCRFSARESLPRLANTLLMIYTRCFSPGPAPLDAKSQNMLRHAQEDLVVLLRLCSATLADQGFAEVPEIPPQILPAGDVADDVAAKPVGELIAEIFRCAEKEVASYNARCHGAADSIFISPRIESTMLQALDRISRTYLVPIHGMRTKETACVGGPRAASHARRICVQKAVFGITSRAYEPDVATAASTLLLTYTRAKSAGVHLELGDEHAWNSILAASVADFVPLPEDAVEKIGAALCYLHGEGIVGGVLSRALLLLEEAAQGPVDVATRQGHVRTALSLLCGIAKCEAPTASVRNVILQSLQRGGRIVLTIRTSGLGDASVCDSAVRLAEIALNAYFQLLDPPRHDELRDSCSELVQEVCTAIASHKAEVTEDELANLIKSLLRLVHTLQEIPSSDNSHTMFSSIGQIVSISSPAVLSDPTVAPPYLQLINRLIAAYPHHLIRAPPKLTSTLLDAVLSELNSLKDADRRRGYEVIAKMAEYRACSTEPNTAEAVSLSIFDSALSTVSQSVIESILLGGSHLGKSLESAADALLSLMLEGLKLRPKFKDRAQELLSKSGKRHTELADVLNRIFQMLNEYDKAATRKIRDLRSAPPILHPSFRTQFRKCISELATVARAVVIYADV